MTQQGLEAAVRGFRWLGHSDQGGRSDGTQVMVSDGYAYVAHPYSRGFSVIDCRDPRSPRAVGVATFPTPSDDDYARKGGTMGPHNVWENRPEAFQSEETIFNRPTSRSPAGDPRERPVRCKRWPHVRHRLQRRTQHSPVGGLLRCRI